MKPVVMVLVIASFAFVIGIAFFGDVTSVGLLAGYIVASLSAFTLSRLKPAYGARLKWAWVALSLAVAFAIFSGPLDYLRIG